MSKPIAQVAFSALLGVGLAVGLSTDMQGTLARVLLKAENSARVHVVNGLQTNFNHYRTSPSELNSFDIPADNTQSDRGHGCESESKTDPND